MTQAEGQPLVKEKSPLKKERAELVDYLTEHILSQKRELVFVISQRPSMDQYMELVGMMGVLLGDESLPPSHQAHLRKMIAVESTMVPRQGLTPGLSEFFQKIDTHVGKEIAQLQAIPSESKLPAIWGSAYADVASIQLKFSQVDTQTGE